MVGNKVLRVKKDLYKPSDLSVRSLNPLSECLATVGKISDIIDRHAFFFLFILLPKIFIRSLLRTCTYKFESSLNDDKIFLFQNKINYYIYIYRAFQIYNLLLNKHTQKVQLKQPEFRLGHI